MFKKLLSGSWRTTFAGIVLGLTILLGQAGAVLDNDPRTSFSFDQVLAGLAAMGLGFSARDNGVTSEAAGAAQP